LPQDIVQSYRWYLRAAEAGSIMAQNSIGDILSNSMSGLTDYEHALRWYVESANEGSPYAQYNLGMMLLNGWGKPVDIKRSAFWFKQAAMNEYRPAQYEIGMMYLEGQGVGMDPIKAYAWLDMSLHGALDAPSEELKSLMISMSPDARIRAVELALRYKERYGEKDPYREWLHHSEMKEVSFSDK